MAFLREFARAEIAILIPGLGAAGLWKILRAGPGLGGLLGSRDQAGRWLPGPLRFQMCLVTLAVAVLYLSRSLRAPGSGALPPVPWPALFVLALSHSAWLGNEVRRRLRRTDNGLN